MQSIYLGGGRYVITNIYSWILSFFVINHFSLQIDSSSNWRKKKIDRNTKITGAHLGTTSSPGLFPSHFLRGKAWGRGWSQDRGKDNVSLFQAFRWWRLARNWELCFSPSPVSERLGHARTKGSFSNDDGDENVKRAIGLISKTTGLHVQQTFCTFLCLRCTTKKWNFLMRRFIEEVGTRRQISLSASFNFGFGPLEFSFREIHLHVTF